MNAVVPFPARAGRDLLKDTSVGVASISRKVDRIIEDHTPHGQAARLVVRAAVLAAAGTFRNMDELGAFLDHLKIEARRNLP